MSNVQKLAPWWGRFGFSSGQISKWELGRLTLWVVRAPSEWTVAWAFDLRKANVDYSFTQHAGPWPDQRPIQFRRFPVSSKEADLSFVPALADRTVAMRLEPALSFLPGEEILVQFSTPLWLRIETSSPPARLLLEIPLAQLSDTWLGPTPIAGEPGYSCFAQPLLVTHEETEATFMARTSVLVRNVGVDLFDLHVLDLPMERMSLFFSSRAAFCTNTLTLIRRDSLETASFNIDRQPPANTSPNQLIMGPRRAEAGTNVVSKTFGALFRDKGAVQ